MPVRALLATTLTLLCAQGAYAQENPFVRYYTKRVHAAQAAIRAQASEVNLALSKWKRAQTLVARGAIPQVEADHIKTDYLVAEKELAIRKVRAERESALLNIAVLRTSAGIEMPICTLED